MTLAEMLRDAGLSNTAFVANNQVAGRGIHFEQGFHRFVAPLHFLPERSARASSEAMHEKVIPWLEQVGDEPFFLSLQTIDPHTPHAPPPEQRDRFDPVPDSEPPPPPPNRPDGAIPRDSCSERAQQANSLVCDCELACIAKDQTPSGDWEETKEALCKFYGGWAETVRLKRKRCLAEGYDGDHPTANGQHFPDNHCICDCYCIDLGEPAGVSVLCGGGSQADEGCDNVTLANVNQCRDENCND